MRSSIGIFDSGVGGLSVLRALQARMPGTRFIYLADSAYAPYGERLPEQVLDRSMRLTERLLSEGAGMVVVACNTATALAIDTLRARWPNVPFVGVEPGIKPATKVSRNGRIGVMATTATLRSARLATLVQRHAAGFHVELQPCPGLAAAIEEDIVHHENFDTLLAGFCEPLRKAGVDTVVLGCTHYPFVARRIAHMLPGVQLVDTAEAVAERVGTLWSADACGTPPQLLTTGDAGRLSAFAARWLGLRGNAARQVEL